MVGQPTTRRVTALRRVGIRDTPPNMQAFQSSPKALVISLYRNRELVSSLVKREVAGRYRGSSLGILWSLFHPIALLALYTLVFSSIFQARWSEESSEPSSVFAVTLFAGLLTFNLFSETLNRAPGLIVSNANFVKKVVFPLELLSVVSVLAAAFHLLVSLGVLLAAEALLFHALPKTALFYPIILGPLLLACLGVSWVVSSLSVFLRDIAQLTGLVATVLLFVSAVFFPLHRLPEGVRPFLSLNPLAMTIEASRDVLVSGQIPSLSTLAALWLLGIASAYLGFFWFQKTRKGFADVL